jgi:hypothetical protein
MPDLIVLAVIVLLILVCVALVFQARRSFRRTIRLNREAIKRIIKKAKSIEVD